MCRLVRYPLHPFGFGCPEQTYSSCSLAALSIESEGFELFEIEVSLEVKLQKWHDIGVASPDLGSLMNRVFILSLVMRETCTFLKLVPASKAFR